MAIDYSADGRIGKVRLWPPSLDTLPIRRARSNHIQWMRGGSITVNFAEIRLQRSGYGPKHFPNGGLVAARHLRPPRGAWVLSYDPEPVLIIATNFEMAGISGYNRSHEVPPGSFIQGCVARIGEHQRLYVVRVPAPEEHADELLDPHHWPRVVRLRSERAVAD